MRVQFISERLASLSASSIVFEDRLKRIELLFELVARLRFLQGLLELDESSDNVLIQSEILEVFLLLNKEI